MENLISARYGVKSLPQSYILSPEIRPGKTVVPFCDTVPIIDLGELISDPGNIIHRILQASQEFGFFLLINHGISDTLIGGAMEAAQEFFELPLEEKGKFYTADSKELFSRKTCGLYTSLDYVNEKAHYWRDNLRHPGHPVEKHVQYWPEKPTKYREMVGKYAVEVRKLSLKIVDLIREGLGLEHGFFDNGLTKDQLMIINHYPPCPDPSLALGLPKHSDINLLTVLLQGDVSGLQVLKDGQWLGIALVPNSLVVNIGCTMQIISNGKLRSADHRVVTNANIARTTVGSFIQPASDSHIEPAKAMVDKYPPALFRSFVYKDFHKTFVADTNKGTQPIERYMLGGKAYETSVDAHS